MPRKKMKLAFIMDARERKATYKKRKKSLLKKVSELSTLCGIQACAIIISPYDSEPEVWPKPLGLQRVVAQFNRMNEMEQTKKMFNQEAFLRKMISKLHKQCIYQEKKNREMEITLLMFQLLTGREGLQNLTMQDLNDLGREIDRKLNEINERLEAIKKKAPELQVATTPPLPPPSRTDVSANYA